MIDLAADHFKRFPPQKFARLFSFTKKKELLKYVHDTVFEMRDLTGIILGCGGLGYTHCPYFSSNDVSHLDLPEGITGDTLTPAMLRKAGRAIEESTYTAFHLFGNSIGRWHFLYFNQKESLVAGGSRFAGADNHVHFINDLWVRPNIIEVVDSLPNRPKGGAHLRIQPQED